jgi:hypothetical protein
MAELISDPRDRTAWLKLADQWVAFSQLPLHQMDQSPEGPTPEGLWRGVVRGPTTPDKRVGGEAAN